LFFNIWNHIPSSPPPFDWISFVVSISKIYLFYFQNSEKKRISVIYRHNPHLSHFKFQNIFTPRSVLYVWTMDNSDTVFFSPPRKTFLIYIYIYIYIYILAKEELITWIILLNCMDRHVDRKSLLKLAPPFQIYKIVKNIYN
jgi:hypothetical protein